MVPKIVAVASTKGGVGKTTIALQIAIERAHQGKEVWLIDGDRQQTAQTALSLRASQKKTPVIACASYTDGELLLAQVDVQKEKWDSIVIDVGGFDSSTLRSALMISDVVVVPFQPRNFDVWGLSRISQLIHEVNIFRKKNPLRGLALLNSADPNLSSLENIEAKQAVDDHPELTALETQLCRRKAFATASGFGLSVSEMKIKDKKAIHEVQSLLSEVFSDFEKGGK